MKEKSPPTRMLELFSNIFTAFLKECLCSTERELYRPLCFVKILRNNCPYESICQNNHWPINRARNIVSSSPGTPHTLTMSEARTGSDSESTAVNTQLSENKLNDPETHVSTKPSEPTSSGKNKKKVFKKDKKDGTDSSSSGALLAPTHLPGMRFSGM